MATSNPTKIDAGPRLIPIESGPRGLFSILPLAFRRGGLSAQYEAPFASERYSLAGCGGVRFGAKDPLRSTTIALGVEGRRYFGAKPKFGESRFFAMARVDLGESWLAERGGDIVGSSFLLEENFGLGGVYVIKEKLAVSLANSVVWHTDFQPRSVLPPFTTATIAMWLSLGWFF